MTPTLVVRRRRSDGRRVATLLIVSTSIRCFVSMLASLNPTPSNSHTENPSCRSVASFKSIRHDAQSYGRSLPVQRNERRLTARTAKLVPNVCAAHSRHRGTPEDLDLALNGKGGSGAFDGRPVNGHLVRAPQSGSCSSTRRRVRGQSPERRDTCLALWPVRARPRLPFQRWWGWRGAAGSQSR